MSIVPRMLKNLALGLIPLSLLTLSACGSGADSNPEKGYIAEPALTGEAALEALRTHETELEARAEHDAERVQVQHVLISFDGAGTRATRSKEEAEQLAAEVYQRVLAGSDFDALVKKYTDDSHPGIYGMSAGAPAPGERNRGGMVPAFGDVGWRLEVGDVGVARFDADKSPYGWHLVKRIK